MVLVGCWPRRMNAELAAAYCGEPSANAFLKRVGSEYGSERGRRLWLRDGLFSQFNRAHALADDAAA